jgi:hypothetical protein
MQIDDVGITAFICRRGSKPPWRKERKFKADCGSKVIFAVSSSNEIKQITLEQSNCKAGCVACAAMIEKATAIIKGT